MSEIEIEIDGKLIRAQSDQTLIQAADAVGIYIPRFCYHKKLSIPANCRMCLVEVEKAPKPLPACATPLMPGMKVWTRSAKTIAAQQAVMEFLLINHPLDCPICDQGGECELQDLAMGYGVPKSHYQDEKRAVADEDLGPLVATEMTRCILCTRCVRFGDEVAGMRELGVTARGEVSAISTYIKNGMRSEVSGNIIDLCPVGALTSKPFRFQARTFEMQQAYTISPHDCLGTHLAVHTLHHQVMRVVAKEHEAINETWIADRDRFSYTALTHQDRLAKPMLKKNGQWHTVSWQEAFEAVVASLQSIIHEEGADQVAALASPNATLEECYLLQKMIRALGSNHIDHRLRETDNRDAHINWINDKNAASLHDLEQADGILLIGSNLRKEQPLAALRVRKAVRAGANVVAFNPVDFDFNFDVAAQYTLAPHLWIERLQALLRAINSEEAIDADLFPIIKSFADKKQIIIILGALAHHHPSAAEIRYLAHQIAEKLNAKLMFLTQGANARGAYLAGAVPNRIPGKGLLTQSGLAAHEMWQQPRKAYLLLNIEPDLDATDTHLSTKALQKARCVIALSLYAHPFLSEHADIILPMAAFTETSGTYVNAMDTWQSFKGVAKPYGESRPAWKILRVLANFLQLDGFEYDDTESIKEELRAELNREISKNHAMSVDMTKNNVALSSSSISRIGEVPIYAIDAIVRRSDVLQLAQNFMEGTLACVKLHPDTASRLAISEGECVWLKQHDEEVLLPVKLDKRIAKDAAWVPAGIDATKKLGDLFGMVDIRKEVGATC